MKKIPRNSRLVYVFATLFVILTLLLPRASRFNYDYRQGSVWKYDDLEARFDFPILKSAEQIADEEKSSSVREIPCYVYNVESERRSLDMISGIDLGRFSGQRQSIAGDLRRIYSAGVVADGGLKFSRKVDVSQSAIYVYRDKKAALVPAAEIMDVRQAREALLESVSSRIGRQKADSLLRRCGIYDAVEPVLEYDEGMTSMLNEGAFSNVSPTEGFVEEYDIIVKKGEIITADIARKLDSYKTEYENRRRRGEQDEINGLDRVASAMAPWVGNMFIAFVLALILCLSVFFTNPNILMDMGRLLFIVFVFLIMTVTTLLVDKYDSAFLFMVPFPMAALWLQSFYKIRVVIPVYTVSLLPLLIFAHNGPVLFVMFLLAGFVSVYVYDMFNKGLMQFMVSLICFLVLLVCYAGFRMIDALNGVISTQIVFMGIGSLVSVIGYSLVFLFERMFKLVSSARLLELTDTESRLLRELEDKAPGTYQHSVQVAAMCEAAARAIGANTLVAKVGALYHDIGKIRNPLCFIENETLIPAEDRGPGYHSGLSVKESVIDIIAHVADGLAIADSYGLPDLVKDFIRTHHGTSRTAYFYNRYVNEGGDPGDVADFTYKGIRPVSKEQVILMVCDTVEAASRTVTPSKEAYSELVEKLVAGKMKEKQLEDADISIKELNMVKESMKAYLMHSHHERVAYPDRRRFNRGRSVQA